MKDRDLVVIDQGNTRYVISVDKECYMDACRFAQDHQASELMDKEEYHPAIEIEYELETLVVDHVKGE